jgi:hypothetical protein
MWKPYLNALKQYYNDSIDVWKSRGFKNTMEYEVIEGEFILPDWLGMEEFHASHRSNLLRKDFEYYTKHGWTDNPDDPYVWLDGVGKWYKQTVGTKERIYFTLESCPA